MSVAFSPTDHRLLAVGYGGAADVSHVALWDIDAGTELTRLPGATDLPNFEVTEHNVAVGAVAFSPDGKYLVAGFGSRMMLMGRGFSTPTARPRTSEPASGRCRKEASLDRAASGPNAAGRC